MTLSDLLNHLQDREIYIQLEKDQLKLKSNKAVDPDTLQMIRENKDMLVKAFKDMKNIKPADENQCVAKSVDMPVSAAQHRMCIIDIMSSKSSHYNLGSVYNLGTDLDFNVFKLAVNRLVDRHEALRTSFHQVQDSFVARVHAEVTLEPNFVKLDPSEALDETLLELYGQPFDINSQTLFRPCIVHQNDTYYMVLAMHHIISDGWSHKIIVEELLELYRHLLQSEPLKISKAPMQFSEYIEYESGMSNSIQAEKQKKYWMAKLKESPHYHSLPLDYERKAIPSYSGNTQIETVCDPQLHRLNTFVKQRSMSLFQLIYAVYTATLVRFSNTNDIVMGMPVLNRDDPRYLECVGLFVNTVALRTAVDEKTTFEELIEKCNATWEEAIEHQSYPFEKVVEILNPKRDAGINPIFQVMLSVQNELEDQKSLQNIGWKMHELGQKTSKFDLTLNCIKRSDSLKLIWEYSSDLFHPTTIKAISNAFIELLDAFVQTPYGIVLDYAFTEDEAAVSSQSLSGLCAKLIDPILKLRNTIESAPNVTAISDGQTCLTYGQLGEKIDKLKKGLNQATIKKNTVVAVMAEKSIDLYALILTLFEIEACFVMVDPNYPPKRIQHMLEDSKASFVITTPKFDTVPLRMNSTVLYMASLETCIGTVIEPVESSGENSASYIMYTSGSTGMPKGVCISASALNRYTAEIERVYAVTDQDCIASVSNISFDVFIEDLMLWIASGAKMVVTPEFLKADPKAFATFLEKTKTTYCSFPTALWNFMTLEFSEEEFARLGHLRTVVIGGEDYRLDVLDKWRSNLKSRVRVLNTYGPTENCPVSTWKDITHIDVRSNIGKPFSGVQVRIVNDKKAPVPRGAIGELVLMGDQLFDGYQGQISKPEAYYTGDFVRTGKQGDLYFHGRKDNQVKISGLRVEPKEFEVILSDIQPIKDYYMCSADEIKKAGGVFEEVNTSSFYIFIVPKDIDQIGALRDTIKCAFDQTLPSYMRRVKIRFIEHIPMTCNGKVDKQKLPQMVLEDQKEDHGCCVIGYAKDVFDAWCAVLQHKDFDIHTNFFDAGGSSFLVLKLQKQIEEKTGKTLSVVDLYRYTTVSEIANIILKNDDTQEHSTQKSKKRKKNIMTKIGKMKKKTVEYTS